MPSNKSQSFQYQIPVSQGFTVVVVVVVMVIVVVVVSDKVIVYINSTDGEW